jgi:integrase
MRKDKHFFNLEATKNSDGSRLIYFNLSYGLKEFDITRQKLKYTPLRISTQRTIEEQYWIGRPHYRANSIYVRKFGRTLNEELEGLEKEAYKQLELFRVNNKRIPKIEELKKLIFEEIKRIEKPVNDLVITEYIDKSVSKRTADNITSIHRWSSGTGAQYTNLKNLILNYQKKKNLILTFGNLNGDIFMDFFKVINELYHFEKKEYYSHNTIAKENKHFRALLNDALENDIEIGFNFKKKDYFIREKQINNEIFLTEKQLQKIIETDVSHSKELTHAKNYIIISSFTGLRIGDMIFLNEIEPENLVHEAKEYFCFTTRIRKSQENKDELIVVIPILKPVKEILEQNNNRFPKFTSQPNIRKCVKKLLKHLNFTDKIELKKYLYLIDAPVINHENLNNVFSPHDCRSTFVTNLKNLGIHDEDIEPITHPKLKNTSIIQTYDKTNLTSKAITLINAVNSKKSELYKY